MARCFVSRALPGRALERLAGRHEVRIWPGPLPPGRADLEEQLDGAEGWLSLVSDRIDGELLEANPALRVVSNYAVGSDNIDARAAAAHGVAVGVTPDVLTEATADLALGLLLVTARRLREAAADVRAGNWRTWEPEGWLGLELNGATLVIVGPGRIGRATGRRAEAFGMRVLYVGRGDDLGAALAEADVVSLHAPQTDATRHLIDARALAVMKPHALLINTARGGLVDQAALHAALAEGRLGGAGLDVTDPEPLSPSDPLHDLPNVVVLPHIGSATHAARELMAERAVDNLLAGLAGEPLPSPAPRPG
ncbi:MAG: D-glycerate dehydrogenase [Actinobacteria bacterium]|nr:D-glycerate dehydrogenase [Actinomycetota bacterium]